MRSPEPHNRPAAHGRNTLAARVRGHLRTLSESNIPITYQALARSLKLSPPNTIHQLTAALECLIAEDADAGHPLIAALVISKSRGGLPAPGFFESAQSVGRFHTDPSRFHSEELDKAVEFWCRSNPTDVGV
ncbi:MAG: hypothetical protein ACRBB0_26315 [Pelagimonas sp.]|uniref:hypothetical protein n=1 Tax=Pelagimonas sp. TaxID=2073170 RepID=UPI003D6B1B51